MSSAANKRKMDTSKKNPTIRQAIEFKRPVPVVATAPQSGPPVHGLPGRFDAFRSDHIWPDWQMSKFRESQKEKGLELAPLPIIYTYPFGDDDGPIQYIGCSDSTHSVESYAIHRVPAHLFVKLSANPWVTNMAAKENLLTIFQARADEITANRNRSSTTSEADGGQAKEEESSLNDPQPPPASNIAEGQAKNNETPLNDSQLSSTSQVGQVQEKMDSISSDDGQLLSASQVGQVQEKMVNISSKDGHSPTASEVVQSQAKHQTSSIDGQPSSALQVAQVQEEMDKNSSEDGQSLSAAKAAGHAKSDEIFLNDGQSSSSCIAAAQNQLPQQESIASIGNKQMQPAQEVQPARTVTSSPVSQIAYGEAKMDKIASKDQSPFPSTAAAHDQWPQQRSSAPFGTMQVQPAQEMQPAPTVTSLPVSQIVHDDANMDKIASKDGQSPFRSTTAAQDQWPQQGSSYPSALTAAAQDKWPHRHIPISQAPLPLPLPATYSPAYKVPQGQVKMGKNSWKYGQSSSTSRGGRGQSAQRGSSYSSTSRGGRGQTTQRGSSSSYTYKAARGRANMHNIALSDGQSSSSSTAAARGQWSQPGTSAPYGYFEQPAQQAMTRSLSPLPVTDDHPFIKMDIMDILRIPQDQRQAFMEQMEQTSTPPQLDEKARAEAAAKKAAEETAKKAAVKAAKKAEKKAAKDNARKRM